MRASGTYVRDAELPSWRSPGGPVASLKASDHPDGTRALIRGRRFVVAAGQWCESGKAEPLASFDAPAFDAGAVLQVTVPIAVARESAQALLDAISPIPIVLPNVPDETDEPLRRRAARTEGRA